MRRRADRRSGSDDRVTPFRNDRDLFLFVAVCLVILVIGLAAVWLTP